MYVTVYQVDNSAITQVLTIDDRDVCRLIMADDQSRPVLLKLTPIQKRAEYLSILVSLRHIHEHNTRLFAVRTDKPVFNRDIEEQLFKMIETGLFS